MTDSLLQSFVDKYLNRKEVMYRLPTSVSIEKFWSELIEYRKSLGIELNLKDQKNNNFWFVINKHLQDNLEKITTMATKDIFNSLPQDIINTIISDALIDEAFNSSVIEGAFSTKKRTKQMIVKKIKPTNKSEQMIVNNHAALEFILENIHRPIDESMVLSIYKILTENTLDPEDTIEKYRNDSVIVWDESLQQQIYEVPHHTQVQSLMDSLIKFINTDDNLHPVIKSCIIHFYFVYIHPFFDGNGRTARAISYMYLLQHGYDFFKFFSISSMINEERSKYYKAIKDVEDYESDVTYFVNYYSDMIVMSIVNIANKFRVEYWWRLVKLTLDFKGIILPERQEKAVNFYVKCSKKFITIEEYAKKFKVAYETARTDLNQLEKVGIFEKSKAGKKFIYKVNDFQQIIDNIKTR